jgi:hypothetical protein
MSRPALSFPKRLRLVWSRHAAEDEKAAYARWRELGFGERKVNR